jgi:hypothetical protein
MAVLFGMQPADIEQCRVLEIGCGDGANLIPMALGLPGSEFVGIDLAASPIAYQQALDFIRFRKFRQTLLCHDRVKLCWDKFHEHMKRLWWHHPWRFQGNRTGLLNLSISVGLAPSRPTIVLQSPCCGGSSRLAPRRALRHSLSSTG